VGVVALFLPFSMLGCQKSKFFGNNIIRKELLKPSSDNLNFCRYGVTRKMNGFG
jgi:hypothetical protein